MNGSRGVLQYVDYEEQNERTVTLTILEKLDKEYLVMNYENYLLYWIKK